MTATKRAKDEAHTRGTEIARDAFLQMKDLADEISRSLGGLDVEVDYSFVDRKWYRRAPTGKVLIDGADLLKFLERDRRDRPSVAPKERR